VFAQEFPELLVPLRVSRIYRELLVELALPRLRVDPAIPGRRDREGRAVLGLEDLLLRRRGEFLFLEGFELRREALRVQAHVGPDALGLGLLVVARPVGAVLAASGGRQ
jgi:hypothetical protein